MLHGAFKLRNLCYRHLYVNRAALRINQVFKRLRKLLRHASDNLDAIRLHPVRRYRVLGSFVRRQFRRARLADELFRVGQAQHFREPSLQFLSVPRRTGHRLV